MTTRADLPRLGASLGVLGTLLEKDGQTAWDVMSGWQHGPRKAPMAGERGGGGGEVGQEDRKDEAIQRARAAKHFQAFRTDLAQLDTLAQSLLRRIDVACPPNPEEVKNRRTNNLDPITATEAAVDGWCASCWRADQAMVPIYVDRKTGLRRYRDYCLWCGQFKGAHGIEPPVELLELHLAGRHLSVQMVDEAVAKALVAMAPAKGKKGKRKKGKAA